MVKATHSGEYEFCFSNEHSSVTNKVIVFHINFEKPPVFKKGENDAEDLTSKIEIAMYNLASKTSEMRRGQEFMDVRDKAHSELNSASHSYITYWSIFECIMFTFVSCCQIWYLKRFFEVRRIV
ncbi:Transmembrane emp24 domain-containing protein 2 [Thelohanellus kitauei]|uniref:Transmembrane emp24 domain-containing protein 2 n=1 Tax=Thelohanellus kitauei TaxID=669202 RepID=A0A0C2MYA7_THEKT|nr:Transmembrane emp24 domain-containing protein 2 [Thelohanellus kitauei]KII72321.1 Transmembrane emp24 domain-containing protein 2 [Thelohanellus kitauei]